MKDDTQSSGEDNGWILYVLFMHSSVPFITFYSGLGHLHFRSC